MTIHLYIFKGKIFANRGQSAKFVKIFPLENNPLYGIQYNIYRQQMHYMDGTDLKVARLQINLVMRIKSSFVTDLKVARLQINLAMRIKSSFVTSTNIIGLDVPRCFTPFLYKSFNHF